MEICPNRHLTEWTLANVEIKPSWYFGSVLILVSFYIAGGLLACDHEGRLFEKLFSGYNTWIRPVLTSNMTVPVMFELFLSQLVKVVSSKV